MCIRDRCVHVCLRIVFENIPTNTLPTSSTHLAWFAPARALGGGSAASRRRLGGCSAARRDERHEEEVLAELVEDRVAQPGVPLPRDAAAQPGVIASRLREGPAVAQLLLDVGHGVGRVCAVRAVRVSSLVGGRGHGWGAGSSAPPRMCQQLRPVRPHEAGRGLAIHVNGGAKERVLAAGLFPQAPWARRTPCEVGRRGG